MVILATYIRESRRFCKKEISEKDEHAFGLLPAFKRNWSFDDELHNDARRYVEARQRISRTDYERLARLDRMYPELVNWNPEITGELFGRPTFEDVYQEQKKDFNMYIENVKSLKSWIDQNKNNLNSAIPKRRRFLHSFTVSEEVAGRFSNAGDLGESWTPDSIPTILIAKKGDAKKTVDIVTEKSSEDEVLVLGEDYTIYDAEVSKNGILLLYVRFNNG